MTRSPITVEGISFSPRPRSMFSTEVTASSTAWEEIGRFSQALVTPCLILSRSKARVAHPSSPPWEHFLDLFIGGEASPAAEAFPPRRMWCRPAGAGIDHPILLVTAEGAPHGHHLRETDRRPSPPVMINSMPASERKPAESSSGSLRRIPPTNAELISILEQMMHGWVWRRERAPDGHPCTAAWMMAFCSAWRPTELVTLPRGHLEALSQATDLEAVFQSGRSPVVAGGQDLLVLDQDRSDPPAQTGGSGGHKPAMSRK